MRSVTVAALGLAWVGLLGCGRLGFDSEGAPDAAAVPDAMVCLGDFLVDTAADDPGRVQSCQGAGCSLRAAIALANARSGSTICIADGVSIALATPLVVSSDVTIAGANPSICGTGADRVFQVAAGGALRLRDLTVCHGRLTDAPGAGVLVEAGAALYADRVVFADHVVISDASQQEGGAIRADGDVVIELRRSRFINNRVTQVTSPSGFARGGAFAVRGAAARVVIEDSVFEDNAATNVGGALFLAMDAANLSLERLLFARNTSDAGAAIDLNCAMAGPVVVRNSTFVGNTSDGGVIFVCSSLTLRLSHCSFRDNDAELVRLAVAGGRVEWQANAIFSGARELCIGPGLGTSLDHNVADRDDALCPLGGGNDRLKDPMLAALADNGGATLTLALLPGSPAIDTGGTSCPPTDQRGLPRPAGAACDVGAFEVQ